jgi:hypothetical protein
VTLSERDRYEAEWFDRRSVNCPIGQSWKKVKDGDDIRCLIPTNVVAGRLPFVRRTGSPRLSLADQIVPALVEVLLDFPHTS